MKSYLIFIISLLAITISYSQTPKVKTGIEVLRDQNFKILEGKKVGLITNPTGVDSKLQSTVDILYHAKNVKLVALFGPEHGVRGDYSAGAYVESYTDKETGLPVYSLYGKTSKPSKEMLKNIDVLVYDIQDIGCRSYTYISTMGKAMEAAAENNIPLVVLDRPNPLGGNIVEGNLVEDGFESFVSQFKIPYVYGLTCGELAKLLNDEGMLKNGEKCNLTVVPMKGWKRKMSFENTGLPWVMTSPHIPHFDTPEYYVASGMMGELGVLTEGVGYTLPFQIFAAEWIDADSLANKMNDLGLKGVLFRPINFNPFYGRDKGKELHGVEIYFTDYHKVNLMSLQFLFMQVQTEMYPDKNPFKLADQSRINFFDKVCGTSKVRELFSKNMKYGDVKDFLNKDVKSFKQLSKKYYLYH
ncbi:MAG: DUF1343 domain-containing protein [Bacteroidetes bacterium]|nr:DUF1343 domain-containing protein [Bacteroidota bacterium]